MKILITGASGLLGRSVFQRLNSQPEFEVTGTAFSRAGDSLLQLDLTDSAQLHRTLQKLQPQIVIHCAAERWPDRCAQQPDASWQLNVGSSQNLAQLCNEHNAQLVYISTDYVFDGSAAPYAHTDATNPVNFYGRSKLAGEQAVLESGNHWVLRLPWLFGPVATLQESGITALLETVTSGQTAKLDDWAIRYPTDVTEVAEVLSQCLQQISRGHQFDGVYQWSGDTRTTRYQLALMVARIAGSSTGHLQPDGNPPMAEPRPYNCHLDKSRLTDLGINPAEPLEQQLTRSLAPFIPPAMLTSTGQ